jgi:hypothetical protein
MCHFWNFAMLLNLRRSQTLGRRHQALQAREGTDTKLIYHTFARVVSEDQLREVF